MREIAICLRQGRAVVSQRIQTPRGPGWEACLNWGELEVEALQAIAVDPTGGPHVYACPPELARAALWPSLEEQAMIWGLFGPGEDK